MTAAHPLPQPPEDADDGFPLTDEHIATLPPEIQEELRAAMAEAEAGIVVPRGTIERTLEEMRVRDGWA
jgi:hypothetical protein